MLLRPRKELLIRSTVADQSRKGEGEREAKKVIYVMLVLGRESMTRQDKQGRAITSAGHGNLILLSSFSADEKWRQLFGSVLPVVQRDPNTPGRFFLR